eukprot:Hpha_TRINITY_DN15501_c2_g2::TRINITY_DN15501_c2_g2_i1::g.105517::m.105517
MSSKIRSGPSVVLAGGSLAGFMVSDLLLTKAPDACSWSVAVSMALCLAAAAATAGEGLRQVKGYLAPFRGGATYGMLQAHGWGLVGVALAGGLLQCAALKHWWGQSQSAALDYLLSVCGLCALGGNALLLLSLEHHDDQGERHKFDTRVFKGKACASAILLSLVSAGLWVAMDYDPELRTPSLCVAAAAVGMAAAFVTHLSASRLPGWRFFQPYQGGAFFTIMQAEGWLWLAVAGWVAVLCGSGTWDPKELVPGVLSFLASCEILANATLLASLITFDGKANVSPEAKPKDSALPGVSKMPAPHRLMWYASVALAVTPPLLSLVAKMGGLKIACPDAAAMILCMFLSAPVSHLSGAVQHPGRFRLVQAFSGGQRFVLSQSFGWTMYAAGVLAVLLGFANGFHCQVEIILPLVFFAQIHLAASVTYFDPADIVAPPGPISPSRTLSGVVADDAGIPLWAVAAGAVVAIGAVGVVGCMGYLGMEDAGTILLYSIMAMTFAGFHIVFTQVWLMMTIAYILMGSNDGKAVMASVGFNVCMMWYGGNILALGEKVPQRAMRGWARWSVENVFGDIFGWQLPHWEKGGQMHQFNSYLSTHGSYPAGFLGFDLAFHFLPCVAIMQDAAELITLRHVVLGYLGARVMSLFVTAHHWNFDYAQIYRNRRLRIFRSSEKITAWPCGPVVSGIYGMEPPPGERFFHVALVLEAVGSVIMAGIVSLPHETKTEILRTLGLAHLLTTGQIWFLAFATFVVGIIIFCIGWSFARRRMPDHIRHPKGIWRRLDDGFGDYAEFPREETKKTQ